MQILVADDDLTYRSLLKDLLAKWDFDVLLASDGLDAMNILDQENPPRLVILDWDMPNMSGLEVATAIREQEQEQGQEAYVLMITGSRRKEDMMQVLVCGADDYLIKPFEPIDLQIHLRSAMRILNLRDELDALRRGVQHEAGTPLEGPRSRQ